ncbi:beta-xylosidase [Coprinopsis cinerea okayama7|uniref:Beta-xylosidase n=1 Tax=Coprinopsis cinerea (strain Okayama-7 / 130 / ATCC MYA-4618 / FGSC 9003) TaxID=240176 RepID=A8NID6_COPC7|nr:beta-xylosidase [Coprinopsis cinerea okayama7\|eukprot:XP_001833975.2 beta-xylosidase [Coprinopsis cinerea okayama7\
MPAPLTTNIFIADPSAHSWNGRIYVYPSHDRENNIGFNDRGDQYDMVDYHVLSMDRVGGEVIDHGVVLKLEDIPWASKQLWAPDAAKGADGKYYLYFPARNKKGIFQIGVAVGDKPEGPFTPEPEPIPGSFSIDPAAFVDEDGSAYLYFGGIWGGQLQCYSKPEGGEFNAALDGPNEPSGPGVPALHCRVAKLNPDMRTFSETVREVHIVDEKGDLLLADDHDRRFFEAPWVHKYKDTYYFSYSTGDTHYICYATSKSPYGPFTYRGRILEPVLGWTTHHSIVEHEGKWYLFYHDCELSKGVDHLRSAKAVEIFYDEEGNIKPAQV